jgi:hypothetical protein
MHPHTVTLFGLLIHLAIGTAFISGKEAAWSAAPWLSALHLPCQRPILHSVRVLVLPVCGPMVEESLWTHSASVKKRDLRLAGDCGLKAFTIMADSDNG